MFKLLNLDMFKQIINSSFVVGFFTLSGPAISQQLSPPPLPSLSPIGLPVLQTAVSCPPLQSRIQQAIGSEANAWSISIADPSGRLLADLNGDRPRIPASNQKLLSTAIAIDRLGPDHRLTTELWQLPDGTMRLLGSGDPSLGFPQLRRFAKLASSSGGSSNTLSSTVKLQLEEEPAHRWWPQGWAMADRDYDYGAPITRLAVTANAIDMSVQNPPARLERLLSQEISRNGRSASISLVPVGTAKPADSILLLSEPSKSMHHLLSLANGESHNFTAEVLLREGTGSWQLAIAQRRAIEWLQQQGITTQGISIQDGSGLDRGNRVTSKLFTALLLRMAQHPYAKNYFASMAVSGQRGTLTSYFRGSELDGRFRGKTGTISGVKALSGVLNTFDGPIYVSMISNGSSAPVGIMGSVLRFGLATGHCR
jgi:D-alanyl-D-alanine carboxypeptidase/D-alanyl-D-alanine-endopeptidase (penicillin-binding protein 4)